MCLTRIDPIFLLLLSFLLLLFLLLILGHLVVLHHLVVKFELFFSIIQLLKHVLVNLQTHLFEHLFKLLDLFT